MDATTIQPAGQAAEARKPLLRFSRHPEAATVGLPAADSPTTIAVMCPLNGPERMALKDCEATIERGLKTFYEIGISLAEIRDSKLYRESYETFQDYCKERWGFAKSRVYQLIEAAKVTTNVHNCGQIEPPKNEAQARELGKLPDEGQATAWQEIVDRCGGVEKVTAAEVKRTVESLLSAGDEPVADLTGDPGSPEQDVLDHDAAEAARRDRVIDERVKKLHANDLSMSDYLSHLLEEAFVAWRSAAQFVAPCAARLRQDKIRELYFQSRAVRQTVNAYLDKIDAAVAEKLGQSDEEPGR